MSIGKSAEIIAMRALVQGHLFLRCALESDFQEGRGEGLADYAAEQQEWIQNYNLSSHMEAHEAAVLKDDLGGWTPPVLQDCYWKIQSFNTLLWATGQLDEMPPMHQIGAIGSFFNATDYPKSPAAFIAAGKKRDLPELMAELDVITHYQWRCNLEKRRRTGAPPPDGNASYEAIIEERCRESIPSTVPNDGKDLLVDGVPFSNLADPRIVISTCFEQLLALSWVLSQQSWDQLSAMFTQSS